MGLLDLTTVAARSAIRAGLSPALAAEDARQLLAQVLAAQDVPTAVSDRLLGLAIGDGPIRLIEQLAGALGRSIGFQSIEAMLQQPRLLLFGPRGSGKTTLAAKLAVRFGEREVLVVSTAGEREALRQLEDYTGILGVPLALASEPEALRKVIAGAAGRRIIIDTADLALDHGTGLSRLGDWIAAAGAEPILTLGAETASAAAARLGVAAAKLGARQILATRADLARHIGGLIAAAEAGRLALTAASVTAHFAFGLQPLTPEALARRLLIGALEAEERAGSAA